jgi:hypothetical protein
LKERVGDGMGFTCHKHPIPLPASPLKGEVKLIAEFEFTAWLPTMPETATS